MARFKKDELVCVCDLDAYIGRISRVVSEEPEVYEVSPPVEWIVRNRACVRQTVLGIHVLPMLFDYNAANATITDNRSR